jgi:hypothetical protein
MFHYVVKKQDDIHSRAEAERKIGKRRRTGGRFFSQLLSRRTFVLCSSTIADIAGYRIMAPCNLDKLVAEIELVAADSLVVVRRSEFVPT